MKIHDLIIIGTGPAGLTAAIYSSRYNLDFLCIGREMGGTANEAFNVQNFPGIPNTPGLKIMETMKKQAKDLGANFVNSGVKIIRREKDHFLVLAGNHPEEKYYSRNILLALGTERRKLQIPGEEEFHGKGVAYCATCDGFFFKNKTVAVIGGGNAAVTSAIFLADLAEKVYLIHRGEELRADPSWIESAKKNKKIEFLLNRSLKEIKGDKKVEKLLFNEGVEDVETDGVFIEIGATPALSIIKDLGIAHDSTKHIIVSESQETNIQGVYAAGDLTTGSNKLKQIVTACSEGAIAASGIYKKLKKND